MIKLIFAVLLVWWLWIGAVLSATNRLLQVSEVAERLGVSEKMVRRLIVERRLAVVRLGRSVRISERDIDALVAAARHEAIRGFDP